MSLMKGTGDIVNFKQHEYKNNYSVYFFCKYDYLAEKFIDYLSKIKECML